VRLRLEGTKEDTDEPAALVNGRQGKTHGTLKPRSVVETDEAVTAPGQKLRAEHLLVEPCARRDILWAKWP
jgi:hypothetical protein